jgi:hypothetical protein
LLLAKILTTKVPSTKPTAHQQRLILIAKSPATKLTKLVSAAKAPSTKPTAPST